ncbi:Hypothetical protein FKW44_017268, partial [Caligus rogercresseyi]
MEAKRQRVADLLHAQVKVIDIMEIVSAARPSCMMSRRSLRLARASKERWE